MKVIIRTVLPSLLVIAFLVGIDWLFGGILGDLLFGDSLFLRIAWIFIIFSFFFLFSDVSSFSLEKSIRKQTDKEIEKIIKKNGKEHAELMEKIKTNPDEVSEYLIKKYGKK